MNGSTILWGAALLPTTFVSATQISAVVTTARIATPGPIAVAVQNPGGRPSATVIFTVGVSPVIGVIAPVTLLAGSPATAVVVTGKVIFFLGDAVQCNGLTVNTTFVSSTQS